MIRRQKRGGAGRLKEEEEDVDTMGIAEDVDDQRC